MLMAVPQNWYSWNFTLTDQGKPLADLRLSSWIEKGVLTIANQAYHVYREGSLTGAFVLESKGAVLARAEKPSAFSRHMLIDYAGVSYVLEPRSLLSRHFELMSGTKIVGRLSPTHFWSRSMKITLNDELELPGRVFVVWLGIILWRRDYQAAAGS